MFYLIVLNLCIDIAGIFYIAKLLDDLDKVTDLYRTLKK